VGAECRSKRFESVESDAQSRGIDAESLAAGEEGVAFGKGRGWNLALANRSARALMKALLLPVALLALAATALAALAGPWPPPDPNKYVTTIPFTIKWAKSLRGFHTLTDLQRAAGSGGAISERSLRGPDPTVSYHWRSEPPNNGDVGYMLATVRPDGRIAVSVSTLDDVEIVLNNEGAFVCDKCKPPIEIQ